MHNKTKILATLGNASNTPSMIESLLLAGVNVFRLNMSHASIEQMQERIAIIRSLEQKHHKTIGILLDLQGPKLRIGLIENDSVSIAQNAVITFDQDPTPGNQHRIPLLNKVVYEYIQPNELIYIDDGKVRFKIIEKTNTTLKAIALNEGVLMNKKGFNLPNTLLPIDILTDKDKADLIAGLDAGVDWVALSFVQRPEDIVEAKKIIQKRAGIVAKIEKPQALDTIHGILKETDALMVARGDLGVELPIHTIPPIQKELVELARNYGKPVIVATQMLESMIQNITPTRAEVLDVANAVYDGADAVMLSAETASGKYPIEAVTMMKDVITHVEQDPKYYRVLHNTQTLPSNNDFDAIGNAANQVANIINAKAILTYTTSGSTSIRASRNRPERQLITLTPSIQTARRMNLVWGVSVVITNDAESMKDVVQFALKTAQSQGVVQLPDDKIVITAGVPFGTPGSTNTLRIAKLSELQ